MKEEQKKIELLQKIAHRLNEAHVQWALGASMLLYFKSITSEFHDIDLMVADHDAECVRRILSEMVELCPPDPMPNPMYRTKAFIEVRPLFQGDSSGSRSLDAFFKCFCALMLLFYLILRLFEHDAVSLRDFQ